jgi:hypothetical protein
MVWFDSCKHCWTALLHTLLTSQAAVSVADPAHHLGAAAVTAHKTMTRQHLDGSSSSSGRAQPTCGTRQQQQQQRAPPVLAGQACSQQAALGSLGSEQSAAHVPQTTIVGVSRTQWDWFICR